MESQTLGRAGHWGLQRLRGSSSFAVVEWCLWLERHRLEHPPSRGDVILLMNRRMFPSL